MKKLWQSTGCLRATWWHRSGGGQRQNQASGSITMAVSW